MTDRRFAAPGDVDLHYGRDLGDPGEFPFTRGIQRDMYAGRPWSIRQYAGFGTAEETNRRFRFLLEQGQSALSIAFDLPTQMGLDADDPLAAGEVGRVGVAINSRGRHGGAVRRHPARRGVDVDDDQRAGAGARGDVRTSPASARAATRR